MAAVTVCFVTSNTERAVTRLEVGGKFMRGIDTQTKKIRGKVLEEVARAAFRPGDVSHEMEEIPFRLLMIHNTLKVSGGSVQLLRSVYVLRWGCLCAH